MNTRIGTQMRRVRMRSKKHIRKVTHDAQVIGKVSNAHGGNSIWNLGTSSSNQKENYLRSLMCVE